MRRAFLACVLLVLSVGTLLAQVPTPVVEKPAADKPPTGQVGGLRFVDQAEVTIVNVDVAVRDKKDGVVSGLGSKDFEVFQDGKIQEIVNFGEYTRSIEKEIGLPVPTAAAPVAAPTPVPVAPVVKREPRFMAIYVDRRA